MVLLPQLGPRQPAHREPVKPQLVFDERARLHLDRLGGDDVKAEPAGGDALEVARRREEVEDLVERPRDQLLAFETVGPHDG